MSDLKHRLDEFLDKAGQRPDTRELTPDASTREYFRINWNGQSAIACVYPESFIADEQTYLDVSRLFAANNLPVAEIYSFDERLGIIVQEDLGDTILRDVLANSDTAARETLIDESIGLIGRIQAATRSAFDTGSIASRLKFDTEKLLWELSFFREHYFGTLRKIQLGQTEVGSLQNEFYSLAQMLEERASVLCHRDFHAANLMVDPSGKLRIIDHQDARIGSPTYDLVSLLLDRVVKPPENNWLASKQRLLIDQRIDLGLDPLDDREFAYEFRLQTVQRCLKAVGTFSFQSVNRGKTYFLPFIKPMFEIVLRALSELEQFPALTSVVHKQLESNDI
jgi:aminoglycoside/choline kinase family phosphotransferase